MLETQLKNLVRFGVLCCALNACSGQPDKSAFPNADLEISSMSTNSTDEKNGAAENGAPKCILIPDKSTIGSGEEVSATVIFIGEVTDATILGQAIDVKNPQIIMPAPGVYVARVSGPGGENVCSTILNFESTDSALSCALKIEPATVSKGQGVTVVITAPEGLTGLRVNDQVLSPSERLFSFVPEQTMIVTAQVEKNGESAYCDGRVDVTGGGTATSQTQPESTADSAPTLNITSAQRSACNSAFASTTDRDTCYSDMAEDTYSVSNLNSCANTFAATTSRFACANSMGVAELGTQLRECARTFPSDNDRLQCLKEIKQGLYVAENLIACRGGFAAAAERFSCAKLMAGEDLASDLTACSNTFAASTDRLSCLGDMKKGAYSALNLVACRTYFLSSASKFSCAKAMGGIDLQAPLAACAAAQLSEAARLACLNATI
jgi:hypothetical protein